MNARRFSPAEHSSLAEPPFQFPVRLAKPKPDASLVNSWWFLIPFGLICAGMVLARAWGYVQ